MYKKHVCEKVHPGVSHESWSKKQQEKIKKLIENPSKPNPSDTSRIGNIRKRAEDWWKSQTKVKPMELKHGGKTKHFRGNKQHD
jgi:uncharacterized protein YcaQ